MAKDEFWYLDNDNTSVTDGNATNLGIRARALLSQGDPRKTVKTIIPLKNYSFFEEFSDKLLPPLHLLFDVTLQQDAEMLFGGAAAADHRIVVKLFELWVPKLMFTPEGKKKPF